MSSMIFWNAVSSTWLSLAAIMTLFRFWVTSEAVFNASVHFLPIKVATMVRASETTVKIVVESIMFYSYD